MSIAVPSPLRMPQRASSADLGGLEEEAFSFGTGLTDMPDDMLPASPPALAPEVCPAAGAQVHASCLTCKNGVLRELCL